MVSEVIGSPIVEVELLEDPKNPLYGELWKQYVGKPMTIWAIVQYTPPPSFLEKMGSSALSGAMKGATDASKQKLNEQLAKQGKQLKPEVSKSLDDVGSSAKATAGKENGTLTFYAQEYKFTEKQETALIESTKPVQPTQPIAGQAVAEGDDEKVLKAYEEIFDSLKKGEPQRIVEIWEKYGFYSYSWAKAAQATQAKAQNDPQGFGVRWAKIAQPPIQSGETPKLDVSNPESVFKTFILNCILKDFKEAGQYIVPEDRVYLLKIMKQNMSQFPKDPEIKVSVADDRATINIINAKFLFTEFKMIKKEGRWWIGDK